MTTKASRLRVAFVGWGAIARAAARLLGDAPVEVVAIATRDTERPREGLPAGAALITKPDELAGTGADLVVEAAGRDSVGPWASAALGAGLDFVVLSVSAFADPELLSTLRDLAELNNAQIQITPGALGGVDALAAARSMGIDQVEHRIVKPPGAWLGTPAQTLCDLHSLSGAVPFFTGSASEAATRFPKNANAAMTTALAGLGPEATLVSLIADPDATANRHEISAVGEFGELSVITSNKALAENPKSSAMAALSLVRAIENRVNPIVI